MRGCVPLQAAMSWRLLSLTLLCLRHSSGFFAACGRCCMHVSIRPVLMSALLCLAGWRAWCRRAWTSSWTRTAAQAAGSASRSRCAPGSALPHLLLRAPPSVMRALGGHAGSMPFVQHTVIWECDSAALASCMRMREIPQTCRPASACCSVSVDSSKTCWCLRACRTRRCAARCSWCRSRGPTRSGGA